ncbi:LysM peptidoglycan-binding domain-containing protein [Candidatus Peregrinibacteria bacterium]|nr:LysM peptidoglycan-binding domain-containing protein [Candidatus Peregrinibacteria bacterium]
MQKAALKILVDRACDINGDGKISTQQEKDLKAEVQKDLEPIYKQIDAVVETAASGMKETADKALELRREVSEGVGIFDIDDLGNMEDPNIKNTYAAYKKEGKYYADLRTQYGLEANEELTYENVLLALDKLADEGNKVFKTARLEGNLKWQAEQILQELQDTKSDVDVARTNLLKAIDKWEAGTKKSGEAFFKGKKVEAGSLAKRIAEVKQRIVAEGMRRQTAGKEGQSRENVRTRLELQLSALKGELESSKAREKDAKNRRDEAEKFLADKRTEYGLSQSEKLTYENILLALDGLADRGNRTYKAARLEGTLPQWARQIEGDFQVYQESYDKAREAYEARHQKVAELERRVDLFESQAGSSTLAEAIPSWLGGTQAEEDLPLPQEAAALALRTQSERIAAQRLKQAQDAAIAWVEQGDTAPRRTAPAPDKSGVAAVKPGPKPGPKEGAEIKDKIYTVKKGDTMIKIAKEHYGITSLNFALELQKNSMEVKKLKGGNYSVIHPGDQIKLPKTFEGKTRLI